MFQRQNQAIAFHLQLDKVFASKIMSDELREEMEISQEDFPCVQQPIHTSLLFLLPIAVWVTWQGRHLPHSCGNADIKGQQRLVMIR